jgi:hypothetical protein
VWRIHARCSPLLLLLLLLMMMMMMMMMLMVLLLLLVRVPGVPRAAAAGRGGHDP